MRFAQRALVWALGLSLLAGCGGAGTTGAGPSGAPSAPETMAAADEHSEPAAWNGEGGCYQLEALETPEGFLAAFAWGETICIAARDSAVMPARSILTVDGAEIYSTENALCAAIPGPDGLWLLEEGGGARLRYLSADGAVLMEADCGWLEQPGTAYLRYGGERLYVIEGQEVNVLRPDGTRDGHFTLAESWDSLAVDGDGQL